MTKKEALQLQQDWGQNLIDSDFHETLYVSIKNKGTKTFRSCSYHEDENYIFIWTKEESFLYDLKDLGDFLVISSEHNSVISVKK